MLLSKSGKYAIQAMIYLAEKKSNKPILIVEISKAYHIPHQYLRKIMQPLVKQRLVVGTRGPKGGMKLAKDSKEILLNQIVYAIDGLPSDTDQCVVGLDNCNDDIPCPFHDRWDPIRKQIQEMLASASLYDLAERVVEKRN